MRILATTLCGLMMMGCDAPEAASQQSVSDDTAVAYEAVDLTDDTKATEPAEQNKPKEKAKPDEELKKFTTTEWIELIPKDELEVLLNPPEYISQIPEGSFEDQVSKQIQSAMSPEEERRTAYEMALVSTNVIEEMNGKDVKIPGFVVPLDYNEKQQVTSFFLVPYFGACIHSPPPPPNQIIYVEYERGFPLRSMYDPVWVYGKLAAEMFEDPMATSAYTMEMKHLELYEEEG